MHAIWATSYPTKWYSAYIRYSQVPAASATIQCELTSNKSNMRVARGASYAFSIFVTIAIGFYKRAHHLKWPSIVKKTLKHACHKVVALSLTLPPEGGF